MPSCVPPMAATLLSRATSFSGSCAAGSAVRRTTPTSSAIPRLKMRHMPFSIGIIERDQWLSCMDQAMGETGVPDDLRERLRGSFFQTADWMRNRGE